jgi:hypothetical protein
MTHLEKRFAATAGQHRVRQRGQVRERVLDSIL